MSMRRRLDACDPQQRATGAPVATAKLGGILMDVFTADDSVGPIAEEAR